MSRQHAHELLDSLGPTQFAAVANLLELLAAEPLGQALERAPVSTSDLTEDTAARIARARASLAAGEGVSHEAILQEFGLA